MNNDEKFIVNIMFLMSMSKTVVYCCMIIGIISIVKLNIVYCIAQNFGRGNFGEFGKTNASPIFYQAKFQIH